jgi:hypothetical protein
MDNRLQNVDTAEELSLVVYMFLVEFGSVSATVWHASLWKMQLIPCFEFAELAVKKARYTTPRSVRSRQFGISGIGSSLHQMSCHF